MHKEHTKKANLLKALGHPVRYCIVEGLCEGENNVSTMVSCTGVPQPTVSQHLTILRMAGIISCKRDGNSMLYSVCSADAKKIIKTLA